MTVIHTERFIRDSQPRWEELDALVHRLAGGDSLDLAEARRLHTLYERASSDLIRLRHAGALPDVVQSLEERVARAYAEIHETRTVRRRWPVREWVLVLFPTTFRRHIGFFWASLALMLAGTLFGAVALVLDPDSRHVTMAFGHDAMRPSERVRLEESGTRRPGSAVTTAFSSQLMVNNTRVSILALSLGMTGGVGTVILLFHNGVILGAVGCDYVMDGQTRFLAGWLLPHGSVELPAILIAGQAGLLLGATLLGRGSGRSLGQRLRSITSDLVVLITGIAVLLVWAGGVEAFFSQVHEPALPYGLKIGFGLVQLTLLTLYLARSGMGNRPGLPTHPPQQDVT
jgi:uncharacterized membrane protein SpoIIM required for sporulation